MKLNELHSISEDQLEVGKTYLCGQAFATCINWTCREYTEDHKLRLNTDGVMLGNYISPIDEVFCYFDCLLIFELPQPQIDEDGVISDELVKDRSANQVTDKK